MVDRWVWLPGRALWRKWRRVRVHPAGHVHEILRDGATVIYVELRAQVCLEPRPSPEIVRCEPLGLLSPLVERPKYLHGLTVKAMQVAKKARCDGTVHALQVIGDSAVLATGGVAV